ncbi:MAG: hypothetical protein GY835_16560, partial [bacterium]|nr:hypothetical protein [bacterium]
MFAVCPDGFWRGRANRRRYLKWLGKQLGFKKIEDWYRVTNRDFKDNHGGTLLYMFGGSPSAVVKDRYPDFNWQEWLFPTIPHHFWDDRTNRRRYLEWLGKQLGFKRMEDWYHLTAQDFVVFHGGRLAQIHNGSPSAVLIESFPEHEWEGWLFDRVPL